MHERSIEEDGETFLECYLCGRPALHAIELAGEDEPLREAAACEVHARGHVHRGILTPAPAADAVAPRHVAR
jgi:hypothetical protein